MTPKNNLLPEELEAYSRKTSKRGVCSSCNEGHEYKDADFTAGYEKGLAQGRADAWMEAIEYLDEHWSTVWTKGIKAEAKRIGVLK